MFKQELSHMGLTRMEQRKILQHNNTIVFRTIIATAIVIMALFIGLSQILVQKYDERITALETELAKVHQDYKAEYTGITTAYSTEINSLNERIAALQTERDNPETAVYSMDMLYKYAYMPGEVGNKLDADIIMHADKMCKKYNVNPHLLWAMVDVESDYRANITNNSSGAKGLGQFMDATARTFYEKYLGYGTYLPQYSYDPYINVDLMVVYLDYLRNTYGDIRTMLNQYSGGGGSTYFNKVNAEMVQHGHDISIVSYQ